MDRRQFVQFMGGSLFLAQLSPKGLLQSALADDTHLKNNIAKKFLIPSSQDQLILAPGLTAQVFLRWGDTINTHGDKFGYNCDYIGFIKKNEKSAYLWVNHEDVHPGFVSGYWGKNAPQEKTATQILMEQKNVGGSLLEITRRNDGVWSLLHNSTVNRRYDGTTEIPFHAGIEIDGRKSAKGTLANCSGGVTPYGTFLSCEENYHFFWGEMPDIKMKIGHEKIFQKLAWTNANDRQPSSHFGYVVEIDPKTFASKKLVRLGRFSHEAATCTTTNDGRIVVYMGDDANNQCFYKFISDQNNSLDSGKLYVADLKNKKWLPLDRQLSPILKKSFKSDLELLLNTRAAANILGGTPMDRPESCRIDPLSGAIFLNCTNNEKAGRPFGSIVKFIEKNGDYAALEFQHEVFISGGPQQGLACPDNMMFDRSGNLWITSDISEKMMNKEPYTFHGNNGLFVIPLKGRHAGRSFRIATAPQDAEFTGPCFDDREETLFLSVQHPGGSTRSPEKTTSTWPDGSTPKPSVVQIKGPLIKEIVSGQLFA